MFWTIPSNPSNPVGPYPGPATGATREPGLLDRLRNALQACHDSKRTEQAYVVWIKQFVYLHNLRHPGEMGSEKEALRSAPESCVAFGCGSSKRVFSIPSQISSHGSRDCGPRKNKKTISMTGMSRFIEQGTSIPCTATGARKTVILHSMSWQKMSNHRLHGIAEKTGFR
jgi:hypothetical protein